MKGFRVIFVLLLLYIISVTASAAQYLIPGGQVIGMELHDNTVTVAAIDAHLGAAAKAAGLREGDQLLRIDDTKVCSVSDVQKALHSSRGQVRICLLRNNKAKQVSMTPTVTADGPKLGVYLKQGTSGVGTVTYYDPQDNKFAALGHGVNKKSGELLQLTDGSIFEAQVQSVKKGAVGTPGQLMGALTNREPIGSIAKNTTQGVFGKMDAPTSIKALPTADPKEVRTGSAVIRSTEKDDTLREYSVEILKIYPNTGERTRNMLLKITDPALLNATGGIVQGMSGSPIIQDGKLVGAVTHVLVNDPTTGYGIFIENMLDAAA